MISTHHKVTETANSQNQTIKPAYFIIWLQVENIKYLPLSMAQI